jgi:UDP-N-acetylmuramate: L-alanyl-gamma-D-glutamyl-meso-diaminopimelate ligase
MHVHILGICGTFMGGLARLAQASGHEVTGVDRNIYPPMSDQLAALGIEVDDLDAPIPAGAELVVIGNALSRGEPIVELVLDSGLPFTSGPAWLAEHVLKGRWVAAVSGTHGKTTTASMLTWILKHAGGEPGFLIGGVPLESSRGSGESAAIGSGEVFVIEADEYDSAFFDKRSKFIHYRPKTLVLNNLEFDHADIFPDLGAIRTQFHHLVRTVPASGNIIVNATDAELAAVLEMGAWTPAIGFSVDGLGDTGWNAKLRAADGSTFDVSLDGELIGSVSWDLLGRHNASNGLAAIAAAASVGADPGTAVQALSQFPGVKRRLELLGSPAGVAIYDDFAHHPTAIAETLSALRGRGGDGRILAILEPRSNTMRSGHHRADLAASLADADKHFLFQPEDMSWSLADLFGADSTATVSGSVAALVEAVAEEAISGDQVVIMSNGGFGGLHRQLLDRLQARESAG